MVFVLSRIKIVISNNASELLRLTVNDLRKIIASEPLENMLLMLLRCLGDRV